METRPLPLSREADKCLTACPKCARVMQARWLRYAHHCRGDLEAREQDAVDRAHEGLAKTSERGHSGAAKRTALPQRPERPRGRRSEIRSPVFRS